MDAKSVVPYTMTVAEAAYFAGLVDGEGTVSLWRNVNPKNRSGVSYKVTFTIAQANAPFLEDVRTMVANGVVALSGRNKPHQKVTYALRFNGSQARWILPQIMPYLRIKRRQAEIVMEYLGLFDTSRRDPAAHVRRAALYEECHALNRRGVVLSSN
jgi:hypothetical protein